MTVMEGITAGPELQKYGGTVFISYARADDVKPPFDKATKGWVTFFWHQLRWELTNAGLPEAKLWLDRYEIEPAEEFTEKIRAALQQARVLVPILSANWIQREYCLKELKEFIATGTGRHTDIVLVKKQEPPTIPDLLKNREGYEFFTKDSTGRPQDFYWRGIKDQAAYFDVLKRLAEWIAARLMPAPRPVAQGVKRKNRTVFLATPPDELRDAWQRVANDLDGSGFTAVPVEGRLPDTAAKAEAEARAALASAEMSVHFLGESEGAKPDGSDETYTRLQLRLAREQARTRPSFQRVLWAPKWLPEQHEDKRDPFEVIGRFGVLQSGEQVYGEEVTDLSRWLWELLDPPRAQMEPSRVFLVVAAAAGADDRLVSTLASRVQSERISVHPHFSGDALPPIPEATTAAVLVAWGAAREIPMSPMVVNALKEWRLACPWGDLGLVSPTAPAMSRTMPIAPIAAGTRYNQGGRRRYGRRRQIWRPQLEAFLRKLGDRARLHR